MNLVLQHGRKTIKCATVTSSLVFQVRGGDVWEMNVVRVASRHEQCGALMWRAGPRCPQTANSQSGRTTSRAVFGSATGTRSCTTGRSAAGTSAGPFFPAAMRSPWNVSEGRKGSRREISPVSRSPMGCQLRMSSVSTLSQSPARSRDASFRAGRTALWLNLPPGRSAQRPVEMGFSIELGTLWLHHSLVGLPVLTSPNFRSVSLAHALLKKVCIA